MTKCNERTGSTEGLASYLSQEKHRLYDNASPARREQMDAACTAREVYRAWNAVCGRTREGSHVTGLHYVASSNELVVYMDAAGWTTEMTLLREIIRARMATEGADIDGLVFKTSQEGYESAAQKIKGGTRKLPKKEEPPHPPLTPAEDAALDEKVSAIEDPKLRQALKNAMGASLSWSHARKGVN